MPVRPILAPASGKFYFEITMVKPWIPGVNGQVVFEEGDLHWMPEGYIPFGPSSDG
jgi:hypothetical protein